MPFRFQRIQRNNQKNNQEGLNLHEGLGHASITCPILGFPRPSSAPIICICSHRSAIKVLKFMRFTPQFFEGFYAFDESALAVPSFPCFQIEIYWFALPFLWLHERGWESGKGAGPEQSLLRSAYWKNSSSLCSTSHNLMSNNSFSRSSNRAKMH